MQHFIINQVRRVGSDGDAALLYTVTSSAEATIIQVQVSSLVCLLLLSSDIQHVDYLHADGVLARETDGFIAENETELRRPPWC